MFDAACSNVGGIPSAIIFRFQHLMYSICKGYRFEMPTASRKTSPGH